MRNYIPRTTDQFDLRLLETIFDFLDVEIEKGTTDSYNGVDVQIGYEPSVTNFYYCQTSGIGEGGATHHTRYPFTSSHSFRPKRIVIELDDGHYELLKEI